MQVLTMGRAGTLPTCSRPIDRIGVSRHSGQLASCALAALLVAGPALAQPSSSDFDGPPDAPPSEADAALGVIGFELCDLDAEGLLGHPDGKRALDYEFCIPSGAGFAAEVRDIDPSARFHVHSRGRIGCGADQVLVLGNTHRSDFAFVLQRLAELPYVERIEQAHFE
jgi:hypothetical protein